MATLLQDIIAPRQFQVRREQCPVFLTIGGP